MKLGFLRIFSWFRILVCAAGWLVAFTSSRICRLLAVSMEPTQVMMARQRNFIIGFS